MSMLAEDYLEGYGGSVAKYYYYLSIGQQPPGSAFYNALSESDRRKIVGSTYDPSHKMHPTAVEMAINFLLQSEENS